MKPFFQHPSYHLHSMLKKLHRSIATTVPDIIFPLEDWKYYSPYNNSPFNWHSKSIKDLSHTSAITRIPTPLVAINSVDTSEGAGASPVSFHLTPAAPSPYLYILLDLLLDLLPHDPNNFLHS